MENKRKISDVKTIAKDGQLYLQYNVESNGKIKRMERLYYDKNGNIDPEVAAILDIAKKMHEKNKNDNQDKDIKLPIKSENHVIPYKKPEDFPEKAKVSKNILGYIATGLAGALLASGIMIACHSCDQSSENETQKDELDNLNNEPTIIEQDEEITKIKYISKEQYLNGVQSLTNYLNTLGFNYQPVDINAFYYSANMDNISNDLFIELVNENYLPDTSDSIIDYTFGVTDDLVTFALKNKSMADVDFDSIFVDSNVAKVCDYWANKYDAVQNDRTEVFKNNSINITGSTTESVFNDLFSFVISEPEKGYNILPTGAQFIMDCIIFDPIMAVSQSNGMSYSQPLDYEIHDMSSYVTVLDGNMSNITTNNKTLTK